MKPVVWVTGAGGLIGNYLCQTAPEFAPQRQVLGLTRSDLDLTDHRAVCELFRRDRPACMIHCAGLTRSPLCQTNPALARTLNVELTRFLVDLAADIPFVFFSTDLVFGGELGNYDESATVNPRSIYAETKALAEELVLANKKHTVVRTSLNGGMSPTGDRGFNEEMRLAWKRGEILNLFEDEFRSPLPACVTARAVWELLSSDSPGLYHIGGRERLSRFEIGESIARRWHHLNPKIVRGSLKSYQGAPRSPDTSLNCGKIQKLLSFQLPGLCEWLASHPNAIF